LAYVRQVSGVGLPVGPGDIVGERYRLVRELGRGGMGVVFEAEHLTLPQRVAIKLMLRSYDPSARARFSREAATVVQLRSDHVRRVLDVGVLESGEPYMVMDLLEGQDLDDLLRTRGTLTVLEVVDYALQACEALAEAHLIGVVHRDLKPSNLFVTRAVDGSARVLVLDFGIAKAPDAAGATGLTESGVMMGSPRFMAPEQLVSARDVDRRADIWALGATIYELLAAQPAFAGHSTAEIHVAILQQEPRPLVELRPDVPPGLAAVIARCLHKDPYSRWPDVAALAAALGPHAPDHARSYVGRIARMVAGSSATEQAPALVPMAQVPIEGSAGNTSSPTAFAPTAMQPGLTTGAQVFSRPESTIHTPKGGLMLGLGIGGLAALVAVLVAVIVLRGDDSAKPDDSCYFERCDPSVTIVLRRTVDPMDYVDAATRMARGAESSAELAIIQLTNLHDGRFLSKTDGSLLYTFNYETSGGAPGALQVGVNGFQMFVKHTSSLSGLPAVEPPRCALHEALAASAAAGGPGRDVAVLATYSMLNGAPYWVFATVESTAAKFVDANCVARDTFVLPSE
jgi:eukaryotic-like serine/threonine-protein kinase